LTRRGHSRIGSVADSCSVIDPTTAGRRAARRFSPDGKRDVRHLVDHLAALDLVGAGDRTAEPGGPEGRERVLVLPDVDRAEVAVPVMEIELFDQTGDALVGLRSGLELPLHLVVGEA
jgi:hypothetical protein